MNLVNVRRVRKMRVYFIPKLDVALPSHERHHWAKTQRGALGHSDAHRTGGVLDEWQILLLEDQLAHRVDQIVVELVEQIESVLDADLVA